VEGKVAFAVLNGRLKMTHIDDIHADMDAHAAELAAETADPAGHEPDLIFDPADEHRDPDIREVSFEE